MVEKNLSGLYRMGWCDWQFWLTRSYSVHVSMLIPKSLIVCMRVINIHKMLSRGLHPGGQIEDRTFFTEHAPFSNVNCQETPLPFDNLQHQRNLHWKGIYRWVLVPARTRRSSSFRSDLLMNRVVSHDRFLLFLLLACLIFMTERAH
jgi:hypothetical protein